MQRGPKPQLPALKLEKGTYQPCRDGNRVELVAPDELPRKPDWLTAGGEEVWIDDVGRAAQVKLASEADTTMFANYSICRAASSWRGVRLPAAIRKHRRRRSPPSTKLRKCRSISALPAQRAGSSRSTKAAQVETHSRNSGNDHLGRSKAR